MTTDPRFLVLADGVEELAAHTPWDGTDWLRLVLGCLREGSYDAAARLAAIGEGKVSADDGDPDLRLSADLLTLARELGNVPRYSVTYDTVTEESAEDGDFADTGYMSGHLRISMREEPMETWALWYKLAEAGVDWPLDPEDEEPDEGEDPVVLAALAVLRDARCIEASSSAIDGSDQWFSTEGEDEEGDGEVVRYSYHFDGLTEAQRLDLRQRFAKLWRR